MVTEAKLRYQWFGNYTDIKDVPDWEEHVEIVEGERSVANGTTVAVVRIFEDSDRWIESDTTRDLSEME